MKPYPPTGKIIENGEVSNSILRYSTVGGEALVTGGEFTSCQIDGSVQIGGWPIAVDSHIACSFVAGNPVITDSTLLLGVKVFDNCQIDRCVLKGPIMVYGTAELRGFNLSVNAPAYLRLSHGNWERPPRFIVVHDRIISESIPGWIRLDCWHYPSERILKSGPAVGRRIGYSESEIDEIRTFILDLSKPQPVPSPVYV